MNPFRLFRRAAAALAVGVWLARKAQAQAQAAGTLQAAKNLRKQGVPLDIALLLLAGRK